MLQSYLLSKIAMQNLQYLVSRLCLIGVILPETVRFVNDCHSYHFDFILNKSLEPCQTTARKGNCPQSCIIEKISDCITASKELKRKYIGRTTSSYRPAGCYWGGEGRTYFNTITNASSTFPKNFGNRGGICRNSGMSIQSCFLYFSHESKDFQKQILNGRFQIFIFLMKKGHKPHIQTIMNLRQQQQY